MPGIASSLALHMDSRREHRCRLLDRRHWRRAAQRHSRSDPSPGHSRKTAVTVACLTLLDMLKAIDQTMRITEARVTSKDGDASGDWSIESAGA